MRSHAWVALLALSVWAFPAAAAGPREPLIAEVTVDAPIAQVWDAWTTKEGIESWMVAKTDFDLRIGALWRTSYRPESNLEDEHSIHALLLSFDPMRMLSFRTVKPPADFAFPNAILDAWTVVYFEPVEERRTKVTARMMGFTDSEESQRMRAFFTAGNVAQLNALVRKFEPPR